MRNIPAAIRQPVPADSTARGFVVVFAILFGWILPQRDLRGAGEVSVDAVVAPH